MNQPHASGSMAQNSQTVTPTDPDNFQVIFESAFETYKEKTKQNLKSHALFTQLELCDSPTAILDLLRGQVNPDANDGLQKWLKPTIHVLHAFSNTIGAGVGLVFAPARVIFVGVGVLLSAVKDLNEDQGTLVEIFEQIENFFRRLEVYTEVQPTPAMKDTMVKIMVEVLDILAIATKEIKQSRAKKFLKKLAGWTDMKDALKKLDKLTHEEARMAGAQVLKNTHVISDKLTAVNTQVKEVSGEVQDVNSNVNDVKRNQLWESLRTWQSPPDPSINHNIACDRQHEGTAEWFFRGGIFKKWKVTGSMLWVHGKPGSGKSVLCSAIINDISTLYKAGSASMAYFYFDFRDTEKQSRRNLLPSLLIQLSARSDPCFDILSRLYEAHDNGARQPNDSALTQCLKEIITLPNHGPIYLILDGVDECPNTSEFPSARRQVLDLLKDVASLRLPNLHICVTSRPEVDIRDVIKPLAFRSVSLHDESGQKEDITSYVRSAVYSDAGAAMRRWRVEEKELVIETLSDRADGMFRWVYCQLEALQNCLPHIDTQVDPWRLYEEKHAASPLYYASLCGFRDLAEYLVKRSQDVNAVGGRHHSTLAAALLNRHTHVAELLCQHGADIELAGYSNRTLLVDGHVDAVLWLLEHGANVNFRPQTDCRASFPDGVTLLSNADGIANAAMDHAGSPLHLASLHDHFKTMQLLIRHGADVTSRDNFDSTPLHLAALRGGTDSVELLIEHGAHVNAHNKENSTPLHLALHRDSPDALPGLWDARARTVEILIRHGADVHARDKDNTTPLHLASYCGRANAMQLLIQHGADVTALDKNDSTPLHLGSSISCGVPSLTDQVESIRLLIQHGADVNARDNRKSTPLHLLASPRWRHGTDHVRLLLEHGADVDATDVDGRTPDEIALSFSRRRASGEIARLIRGYRNRVRE